MATPSKVKTQVKEISIGPAHDPYQATIITAFDSESGRYAVLYSDALGANKLTLADRNGHPIRVLEWHDTDLKLRIKLAKLKANILAKRFICVDFKQVNDEYNAQNSAADNCHNGNDGYFGHS